MTKKVLLFAFLIFSIGLNAQKAQRIGYIDMEYILENVPEYIESQQKINAKALEWQNNIESKEKEIELLKTELLNEKALLTKDLIEDKEEDILIKEMDLKKLQAAYFGTNGDLYFLRKQLVKPVQDLVYNAVQDIAKKRRYDFIFDKSSDLIMLYSNNSFDVSDLVIKSITRIKKTNDIANKKEARKSKSNVTSNKSNNEVVNEEAQKKLNDKEAKRAALKKKIEEQRAAKLKKREELKKAIEEKRQQRIKQIEEAKKAKENKNKNN